MGVWVNLSCPKFLFFRRRPFVLVADGDVVSGCSPALVLVPFVWLELEYGEAVASMRASVIRECSQIGSDRSYELIMFALALGASFVFNIVFVTTCSKPTICS